MPTVDRGAGGADHRHSGRGPCGTPAECPVRELRGFGVIEGSANAGSLAQGCGVQRLGLGTLAGRPRFMTRGGQGAAARPRRSGL